MMSVRPPKVASVHIAQAGDQVSYTCGVTSPKSLNKDTVC
jgi:hypothetical protein